MFSSLEIITVLITICAIGITAYAVKKKFDNKNAFFFNTDDYCDYCGAKLLKNPIGATSWNFIDFACPRCGYNCKKGD